MGEVVGAALIASHFPARMRGALMAGFFATASVGSVIGVMLGGLIAAHWGWQAAFGVVGFPGLLLALLYLKVRDYRTITKALTWTLERSLEKKFNAKTKDAWTVLLTQVTRILSGSDAALLRSVG